MSSVIKVTNDIPAYQYMGYLADAINQHQPFKYEEVNQLGARLSGKTTSDTIELLRAIIAAAKQKIKLVVFVFRMRHKNQSDAMVDILNLMRQYKMPFRLTKGKGV